jgi:hypothetical protein
MRRTSRIGNATARHADLSNSVKPSLAAKSVRRQGARKYGKAVALYLMEKRQPRAQDWKALARANNRSARITMASLLYYFAISSCVVGSGFVLGLLKGVPISADDAGKRAR